MIAYGDLLDHEAVLYFCMEAVSAEAASVLLLDYEKQNFRFYSAEVLPSRCC